MNSKCIICKNRKSCLTYDLGGLVGTWCDKFVEEADLTDAQQAELEAQEQKIKDNSVIERLIKKIKRS